MAFKSILVHLANDRDHLLRAKTACGLAKRFGAHLTALYITTPVSMPAAIEGRGASWGYMAEAVEVAREKAREVAAEFRDLAKQQGIELDFVTREGDHLKLLAEHARFADLAIVSQTPPETLEDHLVLHKPDDLPALVGCPVLILPHAPANGGLESGVFGKRVLIAWKANKECQRAVRDALPFLSGAEQVHLVQVSETNDRKEREPLDRAGDFLSRHGLRVQTHGRSGRSGDVTEILLKEAEANGCDLIVMGGYSRSRLHEMIMGAVTGDMLKRAPLPILMSH